MQVLAYLRVCVSQALAAFQTHSPASIAGLPPQEQQAYVLGYLKEYMSQAWHDKLVASYGMDARAFSECEVLRSSCHQVPASVFCAAL